MKLPDAYRGRRVLVTGHTGFKGAWLALWLRELGAEVWGFALPPSSEPSHFDLARLDELVRHQVGDVRDAGLVGRAFSEARPELVFHLAAQSLVRDSYEDPKGTFDTNVGGTVNVLEAVRASKDVRAAVIVTSDKCYENREWDYAYREADPMGGHDPYSASKGAAELVVSAYRRSFFQGPGAPAVASVRAGNVIGGGDWSKDRLIPDCVRALSRGEPISLRMPNSVRPWQHVLEPLWGYLLLGARLLAGQRELADAFNFGPSHSRHLTVREIAEAFAAEWKGGRVVVPPSSGEQPHEAHLLRLASDKAASRLDWVPVLNAVETIRWTVEWYREWNEGSRGAEQIRSMTRGQIAAYDRLLAERATGSRS